MTLEFVAELPKQARGAHRGTVKRASYAATTIATFLESGEPQTCVEIEQKLPKNMYHTLRTYLKHNPELEALIAVRMIGGKVYLQRLDL